MAKTSVTYVAPKGDDKVTTMYGYTLYDGKAEEVELSDAQVAKLSHNPCFKVGDGGSAGKAAPAPAPHKK